jgi:aryl-phospho-beta-D-glucosidase BglC (GH1 family)
MNVKFRTVVSILIGVLIGSSMSFGQTMIQGTVAISSTGTIDYSQLNRSNGELPRLCGWDLKGMNWQLAPNAWETETVFQQMRQYGVNMVRRHFVTAPLMDSGSTTRTTYLTRMKHNAEMAARHGMWIIFDMYAQPLYHGSGGLAAMYWQWQMPESQFLAMWEFLATELKEYPNVILELGNEPNDQANTYPEHRDVWLQLAS